MSVSLIEKLIEQTCLEQDKLHITIAELWETNDIPLLDTLLEKRSSYITMREKLEKRLTELGGTPKSYHYYINKNKR